MPLSHMDVVAPLCQGLLGRPPVPMVLILKWQLGCIPIMPASEKVQVL